MPSGPERGRARHTATSPVTVRFATASDASAWLALRHALWPEGSAAEHRSEIDGFFRGELAEPLAVVLAVDATDQALGLAELSIRRDPAGCRADRVAYLEGWFVVPEARRQGIGRALIAAAEDWARSQGCRAFASDTRADNGGAAAAHRALGFKDVTGQPACFRKDL